MDKLLRLLSEFFKNVGHGFFYALLGMVLGFYSYGTHDREDFES